MDITVSRVEQWCAKRRKQGTKASTLNRDIAGLKAAISKAVDWEIIDIHPLRKCKQLKLDRKAKVRYLTEQEEMQLRQALEQREQCLKQKRKNGNQWREERRYELLPDLSKQGFVDHIAPMVLLSINTGIRRGELFSLFWSDVDFDKHLLTINGDSAKSGKTRHIPLNQEAGKVLRCWYNQVKVLKKDDELVFPGKLGKTYTNVIKAWKSLLKIAGLENFRWHDMRHHFASKLVMRGVDLNTVRELLGHADLTMTLRYAHLAPEHKASAVAKLLD